MFSGEAGVRCDMLCNVLCDVLYDVLRDVLGEWELLIRWVGFGGGEVAGSVQDKDSVACKAIVFIC